jgi:microcystin-dependent protein
MATTTNQGWEKPTIGGSENTWGATINSTIDAIDALVGTATASDISGAIEHQVPAGGIIMWSGVSIPSGWFLCNGANGTPDLRGRFVVGSGGSYATGATGGADSVTLSTSQIPAHSHSGSTGSAGGHGHTASTGGAGGHAHSASTGSAGSHTHSASTNTVGDHTHDEYHYSTNGSGDGVGPGASCCGGTVKDGGINTGPAGSHSHTVSVSSAGAHTHSVSVASVGDHTHSVSVSSVGDHTHSVSVGNTGGGGSHENRPPYYALAYIMKA